ncbi:MAG TPA: hypothetical protein VGV85_14150 [Longimicrobiaceae bacterium]|nr:hypothetical protein [Longimicrobiaceae bacterium]
MTMTVDLPAHLEEGLREEAEKKGVQPSEHAALLLSICTALLSDAGTTPFRSAVKEFLSHRSLDSDHLATVFEELVQQCLAAGEEGMASQPFEQTVVAADPSWVDANLRAWRDSLVHQSVGADFDWSVLPRAAETARAAGRTRGSARGKYAHLGGTSEDFARRKEEEIAREERRRG